MVGINFSQVHELFDEFADQARDSIDLIAERADGLGGVAYGRIQVTTKGSALPPFPLEERDERRLIEELLGRLDTMAGKLRVGSSDSGYLHNCPSRHRETTLDAPGPSGPVRGTTVALLRLRKRTSVDDFLALNTMLEKARVVPNR